MRRTIWRHSLSALSVTEQVLITYTSAWSSNSFFSNPSFSSIREMVEVSEKLSLQPNVCNATVLASGMGRKDNQVYRLWFLVYSSCFPQILKFIGSKLL